MDDEKKGLARACLLVVTIRQKRVNNHSERASLHLQNDFLPYSAATSLMLLQCTVQKKEQTSTREAFCPFLQPLHLLPSLQLLV